MGFRVGGLVQIQQLSGSRALGFKAQGVNA